ncbi:hypothetical protein HOC37_00100 [bacterium]|jgi:hypothetical protein|nr:hypothetical protein [bacterium]MBT3581740.1 hypothetical protein [bacterium]MBT4551368.1 hypothetical protein [bacterium]MBT5988548.1 hypothetical protein [bacterium]MBT7088755.1 hypothetical protein [bacterium]
MEIKQNLHQYQNLNRNESDSIKDSFSVSFNIRGSVVVLSKEQLGEILKRFAGLAMERGLTNNENDFRKEMTNTLFAAYKKYEEEEKRKKKKRHLDR